MSGAGREPFGTRLQAAVASRGTLCVGIDPHPALLHQWELNDDAAGVERFSLAVVDALGSGVAVLKPQVALYERHGSAGIAVLEKVLAAAAATGVLTIADAKRGDIGSTMSGYADAWLRDGSFLAADAVTLSPYLGFESLRPALDLARKAGRGVFVLALTSNPEGAGVQHAGGRDSVAGRIIAAAQRENLGETATARSTGSARAGDPAGSTGTAESAGSTGPIGSVGLVIGATVGRALTDLGLDIAQFNGPILAPGYGAQGASAADIKSTFGRAYHLVLASSSRGVLAAGPDRQQLQAAARDAREDLSAQRGEAARC